MSNVDSCFVYWVDDEMSKMKEHKDGSDNEHDTFP